VYGERGWVDVNINGDYDAAERDYRKAVTLSGPACNECLQSEFIDVLVHQQKYEDAIQVLSAMLSSNPSDVKALSLRGYAFLQVGNARDAVPDLTKAAEAGDASAQDLLGVQYMMGVPGVFSPDPGKGVEWLRKSAAQGFAVGQQNLEAALRLQSANFPTH
jgi:TPR repeat protein